MAVQTEHFAAPESGYASLSATMLGYVEAIDLFAEASQAEAQGNDNYAKELRVLANLAIDNTDSANPLLAIQ